MSVEGENILTGTREEMMYTVHFLKSGICTIYMGNMVLQNKTHVQTHG